MDDNTQLVQKEEDDQNLLSMMLNRCLSTGSSEGDSQSRETNVDYLSWSNISREASTLEFSRAEDFVLYLTEDCQSALNLNSAQTENIFSNMNCLIIHRHEGWAAKLGDILRKLLSRSIWNLGPNQRVVELNDDSTCFTDSHVPSNGFKSQLWCRWSAVFA